MAATGQADLTDAVRALVQPLLPVERKPGRPLTRITILRSRGAGSTKVHLILCRGWPLALLVAVGLRGDRPRFTAVIEAIEVPRHARSTAKAVPHKSLPISMLRMVEWHQPEQSRPIPFPNGEHQVPASREEFLEGGQRSSSAADRPAPQSHHLCDRVATRGIDGLALVGPRETGSNYQPSTEIMVYDCSVPRELTSWYTSHLRLRRMHVGRSVRGERRSR